MLLQQPEPMVKETEFGTVGRDLQGLQHHRVQFSLQNNCSLKTIIVNHNYETLRSNFSMNDNIYIYIFLRYVKLKYIYIYSEKKIVDLFQLQAQKQLTILNSYRKYRQMQTHSIRVCKLSQTSIKNLFLMNVCYNPASSGVH